MKICFRKIRPHKGDQRGGFEEFCCQMAEEYVKEKQSTQSSCQRFIRKEGKGGDAGVECYYTFSDGSEWGWQAKYFIDGIGENQWKQIDKSVETALAGHSTLERYTICLPINLSDFRKSNIKSQIDHWDSHKAKWEGLASERNLKVDFVYWGESELRKKLLDMGDRSAGYIHYWFDEDVLTSKWFRERFEVAKGDAGPRYTPEIHVDLPLCSLFDSFCRSCTFPDTVTGYYDRLLRGWKEVLRWEDSVGEVIQSQAMTELRDQIENLASALDLLARDSFQIIDRERMIELASDAMTAVSNILDIIKHSGRRRAGKSSHDKDSMAALQGKFNHLYNILDDIFQFLMSRDLMLANSQFILLSGKAGTGKTHLFCDVARSRIEEDVPSFVLLGQKFSTGSSPWSQITDQLDLGQMTPDKFLGLLDAAARTRGKRALILIDALNEGPGARLWRSHIAGMLASLSKYSRVVLAMSCRDSYIDDVFPEELLKSKDVMRLEHRGFAGKEFDATHSFFKHYGIQGPTEPLLVPEFSNPLFLKLMCQGLVNAGIDQLPKGLKGISAIFEFFIDSINLKLSQNLSIDPHEEVVHKIVKCLAQQMADKHLNWLDREEVKVLINKVRQEPPEYDRTLFRNLIHEGLLREDIHWDYTAEQKVNIVSFAYQRLNDYQVASCWITDAQNNYESERILKTLQQWYKGICGAFNVSSDSIERTLGKIKSKVIMKSIPILDIILKEKVFDNRHAGWIEALSIQMPESLGKELMDLDPRLSKLGTFRRAFILSLPWRSTDTVESEAVEYFIQILTSGSQPAFKSAMETLLMVSCEPDHPLNANWLHNWLTGFSMADRDHVWSIFLHEQYEWKENGPIERLLEWAWHANKDKVSASVVELCAILLTWFLTSSHRFLRDRSTKALLSMLRCRPRVLLNILDKFEAVNDPYVMERLYCVAYGVAMTTPEESILPDLAEDVYNRVFADGFPVPHILLRDYARGVIEVAYQRVRLPAIINRNLTVPPYKSDWPLKIPRTEDLENYGKRPKGRDDPKVPLVRLYHNIMDVDHGFSDWVIYILRPECHRFAWIDPESLGVDDIENGNHNQGHLHREFDARLAQRWIMNRILELGWTVERFGKFDENINRDIFYRRIDSSKPERMGKKYAWIGMHEFLAYLADNVEYLGDPWHRQKEVYEGPWQFGLRDIDPSLLISKTSKKERSETVRCWWQPIEFTFTDLGLSLESYSDWVKDSVNFVDPLKLIQVKDASGKKWLTLEGFYDWTETTPVGEDPDQVPRRNIWVMLKSYIVESKNSDLLIQWINSRDLWGRWMPESDEMFRVFLGEYPWAASLAPYRANSPWTSYGRQKLPHSIIVTTMEYLSEKGYDCSIDSSIRSMLPSPWLVEAMDLRWAREGFSYLDIFGSTVARDPAEREKGPSVLIFDLYSIDSFLKKNNYDLIWTVLGERTIIQPLYTPLGRKSGGYAVIQGVYKFHNGEVTGGPLREDFHR